MMARISRNCAATPPSADLAPAFAVAYDNWANPYNSGYDADRHRWYLCESQHRHGAASHNSCSANPERPAAADGTAFRHV